MIEVPPRESLLFIYREGCEACEAARPELEKFEHDNPSLMVLQISADGPYVRLTGARRVDATPLYVFRRGEQGFAHEGLMKAKEISKWITAIADREEG